MFGRFALPGALAGGNAGLVPHGNFVVLDDRPGLVEAHAYVQYKDDGTLIKGTHAGTTLVGTWLTSGVITDFWMYGAVTYDSGTGTSQEGVTDAWFQMTTPLVPFGLTAGPAMGFDDEECHIDIFIKRSVGSPVGVPTIGSPGGSTYMGTVHIHAISEP